MVSWIESQKATIHALQWYWILSICSLSWYGFFSASLANLHVCPNNLLISVLSRSVLSYLTFLRITLENLKKVDGLTNFAKKVRRTSVLNFQLYVWLLICINLPLYLRSLRGQWVLLPSLLRHFPRTSMASLFLRVACLILPSFIFPIYFHWWRDSKELFGGRFYIVNTLRNIFISPLNG